MPPTDTASTAALPTLRERKKAETWFAIHDAAAELALEGEAAQIGQITVELIATEAGVSQRTFFNYFPSKEDAILGVRTPTPPELPEDFLDEGDLIRRVADELLAVGRRTYAEGRKERRMRLYDRYPHLLLRRRELMIEGEELVYRAVAEAMADHPDWSGGFNGHSVEEIARMLTLAAGVPLRYLVVTAGPAGPRDLLAAEAVQGALDLYQDLNRKLS